MWKRWKKVAAGSGTRGGLQLQRDWHAQRRGSPTSVRPLHALTTHSASAGV